MYLDDIMISVDTIEEHDNIVDKVIQRAGNFNMKFNFAYLLSNLIILILFTYRRIT